MRAFQLSGAVPRCVTQREGEYNSSTSLPAVHVSQLLTFLYYRAFSGEAVQNPRPTL